MVVNLFNCFVSVHRICNLQL